MISLRRLCALPAMLYLTLLLALSALPAAAADEAIAASGPPLNIALFVKSSPMYCYNDGRVEATEALTRLAVERINQHGGVRGRRINYTIYDNGHLPPLKKGATEANKKAHEAALQRAVDNVKKALAQKDLIAMIGLENEERAKAVFELVAKDADEREKLAAANNLARKNGTKATENSNNVPEVERGLIPFISNISVGATLRKFKNVYSTRPSQEDERVPVMTRFFQENNIKTIGYLGRSDKTWANAIRFGLNVELQKLARQKRRLELERKVELERAQSKAGREISVRSRAQPLKTKIVPRLISDNAIDVFDRTLDTAHLDAAIADIEEKKPEILVVSVGTALTADVVERLKKASHRPPIFMVGWLSPHLDKSWRDPDTRYPQPIYGIDWATVPEVESDRLFNVLGQGEPEEWFFAGREAAPVATWNKNRCNKYYANYVPSTFSPANIAAAKEGALFADMLKLVTTSANRTGSTLDIGGTHDRKTTSIEIYREAILNDLKKKYAAGRGAFKGIFENWSFHPKERVRAQTPMIAILPSGLGKKQLAPTQFVRLRNGGIKSIETVYMDIDMVRTHSVDNNKKSFFAEFYLAMRRSARFKIEDITFTNAFLDPRASRDAKTNGREISIEVMHPGGKSDSYPADMQVYKVAGRFRFRPDFSKYPFDTQQFSIDIQPRNSNKTFIVQPPPADLRDAVVASEGWIPDKQYVSFVEDFVPIVDAFTHRPSVVPFYNSRFVWQMKRETTDYYIRVVVPLAFILIVAYLSIFIPKANMEAIVTIQITALLAAVALYLSLPQIDTDTATISDQIFMFDYMMVSLMIIISILRINANVMKRPWITNTLAFIHIVILPTVLLGLVLYFSKADILTGFIEMPGWKLLGLA